MFLRPADEFRVFHDAEGRLTHSRHGLSHPRWGAVFMRAHNHDPPAVVVSNYQPKLKRWLVFAPVATVVFGLITFGALVAYYHNRALPGTSLASVGLSGKTEAQAVQLLQAQASSLKAVIEVDSQTKQVSYAELGLTFDVSGSLKPAFDRGLLSPPGLNDQKLSYRVKVDDQKLQAYLANITKVNQAAVDASIEIKDGKVVISPEKAGKSYGIDPAIAKQTLLAAARSGQSAKLTVANYSSKPAITSDLLATAKTEAETMIKTPLTITVHNTKVVPNPAQIGSWLIVTKTKQGATIAADSVRVGAYLDAVAKPYVKPPRAKVVVQNEDGSEKVLSAGASGIDITNKEGSAKEIATAINQHTSYNKALTIAYSDPKTIKAADYAKWIDVDLTNKRMYAYEHGTLVKEFLVSAGAPATPTVKGQFAIKTKVRKQDMRGFNADGSRYLQPDVEYVNYFYQDYAIHGNYWRPKSYFGNVNSSHGCVGVVNNDAAWIYDWAPVGTVVITHD